MFQEKKYIVVAIVIIIVVSSFVIIYYLQGTNPNKMIESRFDFKLPPSSKVLNFEYHNHSKYFGAKISIENQDVEDIKKSLINYFEEEYSIEKEDNIPNFRNNMAWWDLDKKSIEVCYNTVVSGEKKLFGSSPKSRDVWAFITKDKDGRYYLYISY